MDVVIDLSDDCCWGESERTRAPSTALNTDRQFYRIKSRPSWTPCTRPGLAKSRLPSLFEIAMENDSDPCGIARRHMPRNLEAPENSYRVDCPEPVLRLQKREWSG